MGLTYKQTVLSNVHANYGLPMLFDIPLASAGNENSKKDIIKKFYGEKVFLKGITPSNPNDFFLGEVEEGDNDKFNFKIKGKSRQILHHNINGLLVGVLSELEKYCKILKEIDCGDFQSKERFEVVKEYGKGKKVVYISLAMRDKSSVDKIFPVKFEFTPNEEGIMQIEHRFKTEKTYHQNLERLLVPFADISQTHK